MLSDLNGSSKQKAEIKQKFLSMILERHIYLKAFFFRRDVSC